MVRRGADEEVERGRGVESKKRTLVVRGNWRKLWEGRGVPLRLNRKERCAHFFETWPNEWCSNGCSQRVLRQRGRPRVEKRANEERA